MVQEDEVCACEVQDVDVGFDGCAGPDVGGVAVLQREAGESWDLDRDAFVFGVDWRSCSARG